MSAETELRSALLAALRADDELTHLVNGVYEEQPLKASVPFIVLLPSAAGDWGTKDRRGRELRLGIAVHDRGSAPSRLGEIAGALEAAIEKLPREAGGYRIASLAFLRSRVGRERDGRWTALIEYRARLLEI